ncbi:hypothetical protein CCZ01_04655 [Helicobacter monodelphidis]|uniref:hypothetical protein n=1 Tax=Helicobacter sp. 15-1451 TaxID=2004995 RepID=UPI000DCB7E77|nr:hypothetical protein [Helicobacter sp. 15-1451]RAX57923.1 hypothetical protein CCZ01_04655 [Helicobacter sp. 15-1451]
MKILYFPLLLFLFSIFMWADNWKYQGEVELKKDEIYHLAFQEREVMKDLYFRWTLHKNQGLVMHVHYDGFVHQFILYERYHRRGFKVQLFKHNSRAYTAAPYIWIRMVDYKYDTKTALIRFLVHDGNKEISLVSQEKVNSVGFRGY